ncbi:Cof-type HAD-IIB family hydrolase [uncultured Clostridium sp.]|uniref:Cof-type HAD-IIB family hydrolase n=1 Tax=uncultured Clostridium sp. TaxID=59620 RepID=UPI002587BA16|nr:Cof-type HAD-IIB family hydrolase [uncultured Clostridium sp.]
MKYKMMCIDMDGTLLGKGRKISEESKIALRKAREKGVQIVITTGRLYNNAAYFSELVGVDSPVIGANGAIIREKRSNEIIYRSSFNEKITKKILELANKYRIVLHFHTVSSIISNSYVSITVARIVLPGRNHEDFKVNLRTIKGKEKWLKALEKYSDKVTKIIVFSTSAKRMEEFRKEIGKIDEITYFTSGNKSMEINMKEVSKGNAVKILADYYGIKREEVICIGDNENDVSMIEYAGLGIAMGNAIPKLKKIADYVTDTNKNDGVRKAVEKFILREEDI